MNSTAKIVIVCILLFIGFHLFLYAYFKRKMAEIKANAPRQETKDGVSSAIPDDQDEV
jgi:uncharacterized MAPEG superfamily protein